LSVAIYRQTKLLLYLAYIIKNYIKKYTLVIQLIMCFQIMSYSKLTVFIFVQTHNQSCGGQNNLIFPLTASPRRLITILLLYYYFNTIISIHLLLINRISYRAIYLLYYFRVLPF